MKRLAILIEASKINGETELPGTIKDVENWQNFLMKPLGGGWAESEIMVLPDELKIKCELENILHSNSDKYCFVVFSGHGQDGSVALNDKEKHVPYDSFVPCGAKGTLIIDACRGSVDETSTTDRSMASKIAATSEALALSADEALQNVYATRMKDLWLTELGNCQSGKVKMLSCSKDEGAGEDPEAGGFYTSLLIHGAEEWERDPNKQGPSFSTLDAHDYAVDKLPSQQNPEYFPNRKTFFPLAVKTNNKLRQLLDKEKYLSDGRAGTSADGTIGKHDTLHPIQNPPHKFYG